MVTILSPVLDLQTVLYSSTSDRSSLIIQLAQTPIIGGILGWLFLNEGYAMQTKTEITAFKHEGLLNMIQLENGIHPSLFLMGAAAFWFGCSNVAREIVSERAVYLRERRSGLQLERILLYLHTNLVWRQYKPLITMIMGGWLIQLLINLVCFTVDCWLRLLWFVGFASSKQK